MQLACNTLHHGPVSGWPGLVDRSISADALLHAMASFTNPRAVLSFCHNLSFPWRTPRGMQGSLTLEEVAGSMSRPLTAGTLSGYLAACLEAGLTFEWDRRRLGIDQVLEGEVREARAQGSDARCKDVS